MTKIFNALIVVLLIALIATFIVSAVSLQSKTEKILSTYSVKREELATRQQQIQDMIVSLNSTLQSEIVKQQVISTQLSIKANKSNNIIVAPVAPVITPTPVVVSTPIVTPAPVHVTPRPVRVARAS